MMIVYGKSGCSFCEKAKNLLEEKNIAYTYKSIDTPVVRLELMSIAPETKTVPQIWEDDVYVGGYTELVEYLK